MSINTTLAGLSQNEALNGPDGATDLPSQYDNAIRYALSFTAQLRDGVGFTASGIPLTALASMPVIRGGIAGTDTNPVNLGWNASLGRMVVASNGSNFSNRWPIDVDGPARSLRSGGTGVEMTFAWTDPGSGGVFVWCGDASGSQFVRPVSSLSVASAVNATNASTAAACTGNSATATTATNANALGGVAAASYAQYTSGQILSCEGPRDVGTIGRAIPNLDNRIDYFNVGGGSGMVVNIDGADYGWPVSISDERLKTNIRPTQIDSVTDISAIEFAAFDFRDDAVLFVRGKRRSLGVIAQQVEKIRADWVMQEGEYKQLDTESMLMSALHAIQQQGRTIAALIARVEALEAAK